MGLLEGRSRKLVLERNSLWTPYARHKALEWLPGPRLLQLQLTLGRNLRDPWNSPMPHPGAQGPVLRQEFAEPQVSPGYSVRYKPRCTTNSVSWSSCLSSYPKFKKQPISQSTTAEDHSFTRQLVTTQDWKIKGWVTWLCPWWLQVGEVVWLFVSQQAFDAGQKKTLLSAEYLNEPFRAQRAMSVVSIMTSVLEGKYLSLEHPSTVLQWVCIWAAEEMPQACAKDVTRLCPGILNTALCYALGPITLYRCFFLIWIIFFKNNRVQWVFNALVSSLVQIYICFICIHKTKFEKVIWQTPENFKLPQVCKKFYSP